jgi:membrane peptidoglycan carboxypeptidase
MNFSAIKDSDYTLATSVGGFTEGVSPLEMASAYATLENDGLYRQPTCIKSIVDSDENIVYASEQTEVVIYEQDAARIMTDVLTTVMESGTGRSVKLSGMPCAGKTGTTNDYKDGWFVGYTRYYTTSVWVGYDYPKQIPNLSGGKYPGKIWNAYMTAIHEDLSPMDFLPYAQLSDDFVNQKKQEEEDHDKKREENQNNDNEEDEPNVDEENQNNNDTPQQDQADDSNQTPEDGNDEPDENDGDADGSDDGGADAAGDGGDSDVDTPE